MLANVNSLCMMILECALILAQYWYISLETYSNFIVFGSIIFIIFIVNILEYLDFLLFGLFRPVLMSLGIQGSTVY